jgi:uncharacterized protein DUF6011
MNPIERLSALLRDNRIPASSVSFAADLVRKSQAKPLSPKQMFWVNKLADEAERPAPVATQVRGDVAEIFALFERASENGLKWPKIHLHTDDGQSVRLSRAGEKSRYVGQIMVTDGGSFGSNKFFGRIDETGNLTPGRDMTRDVARLIEAFAADPAAIASMHGKRTGNCCFCHKDLTTRESLAVGYGPVCAEKFGLPWGEVVVNSPREPAVTETIRQVREVTRNALTELPPILEGAMWWTRGEPAPSMFDQGAPCRTA